MGKKFVFDLTKLRKGDILFSSSSEYLSRKIARVTGGKYSHVMIDVGNSVIHAMPDGVYSKNPQRMIFDSPDHFGVMRLADEPSQSTIDRATDYARHLVGSLYSIPEAGASAVLHQTDSEWKSTKQYCSRLVAHCFQEAGIRLVHNADYCTPNDIAKSPLLVDVADYYREAHPKDIAFAATPDPVVQLQREEFAWIDKVRELAETNNLDVIAKHNDVYALLIRNPKFDSQICEFVKQTQYLNLYNLDRGLNPHRYDEKLFLERVVAAGSDGAQVILSEYSVNENDINRRAEYVQMAQQNYSQLGLGFLKLELELAENIYGEVKRRVEVIDNVCRYLKCSHLKPASMR